MLLGELVTEQVNTHTADLDLLPVAEALERLNDEDQSVPAAVRAVIPSIARAVELIEHSLRLGGRLIYVGAGTSGRLGCLDASEIPPTFGMPADRVMAIIAGGDRALRTSIEGAEDDPRQGAAAIAAVQVSEGDTVCGIAASGRTPFVLGAIAEARARGAATVGVTTNPGSELSTRVDVVIAPVVGPEPVSGSTRMKSGTAQKLVLNMLSTMAMVRLGKTYGNLMVDVRATNHKLVDRAVRLVVSVVGCDGERAGELLETCGWDVKLAILVGRTGWGADEARARLEQAGGMLRRVLHGVSPAGEETA